MGISEEVKRRVLSIVDDRREEIIGFLRKLVKTPSLVGSEGKAQKLMAETLNSMDLEVDVWEADLEEISKHPAYIKVPWSYQGRPNVIGTLKGRGNGRSLILNGHVDVVSPEPIKEWKHNPWGAEIEDGKVYGRGACDMKGGIAAMIYAVKCIKEAGIKLKGDITIESVIEEEAGGGGGTLATILKGYKADAALIPEPSDLMLGVGSVGVLYFRVKVKGRTAHAGMAHTGVNAIGKAMKIYDALMKLDEQRGRNIHHPLIEKYMGRSCNINIGTFKAGDWPSTVAGWAEMECRASFIPGEKMSRFREIILETIRKTAEKDEWLRENPPTIDWFGWQTEPYEVDMNHSFIKTVEEAARKVTNKKPEYICFPAGLDARLFVQCANIPAIVLGPGPREGNIHGVDEYVLIDDVVNLTKIITLAIIKWCGI